MSESETEEKVLRSKVFSRRRKVEESEGAEDEDDDDESEEDEGKEEVEKYALTGEASFNLAKVKLHALRMIEDRGYKLDEIDTGILKRTPEDLSKRPELLRINKFYEHESRDARLHLVFLAGGTNATINKPIIQKLLSSLSRGQKPKVLVMIGDVPLGAKAIDKLLERKGISSEWFVQFFRMEELLYSPINHTWAPKYIKLSDEEKINLRKIEGISLASLPLMRYADLTDLKVEKDKDKVFIDPICKYYGFEPNDVVKELGRNIALNFLCPVYLLYRRVSR